MRRIKKGDIVRMRPENLKATFGDFTLITNMHLVRNPKRMFKVERVDEGAYYCASSCPAFKVCKFRLNEWDNPYSGGRDRVALDDGLIYCEADLIKVVKSSRFLYEIFGPDGLMIYKEE